MHCTFLVFFLIVFSFFSFLFFSSACEFRVIERIGAHGKQNPGFIIIYYNGALSIYLPEDNCTWFQVFSQSSTNADKRRKNENFP